MTRAQRNHNPLNIKKGSPWRGMDLNGTDDTFVTFISDEYGFRAAFRIIKNYIASIPPDNTIMKIVIRWAPPSDGNPTSNYIDFVEQHSGIHRHTELSYNDHKAMIKIVKAMARFESGISYPDDVILKGYMLEKK